MYLSADPRGHALLVLDDIEPKGCLSLLPVTKIQFERFLVGTREVDDVTYARILEHNPRISLEDLKRSGDYRAFLTGASPTMVEKYAQWTSDLFSVPDDAFWRAARRRLGQCRVGHASQVDLVCRRAGIAAEDRLLIRRLMALRNPGNWSQLALMENGLMEWVMHDSDLRVYGSPDPAFDGTIIAQSDKPLSVFSPESQWKVGFRVWRAWRAEDANCPHSCLIN